MDDRLVITLTISKLAGGGTQSATAEVNGASDSRLDTPLIIPVIKDISETSVSVSESVSKQVSLVKPISESSVSVSDSIETAFESTATIYYVHCVEFPELTSESIEISTSAIIPVSTSKTHKFDIIEKVSTTKTHKYNLIGFVSTTKTHKFNLVSLITRVRTHKL